MKKIKLTAATVLLATLLVACGKKTGTSPSSSTSTTNQTKQTQTTPKSTVSTTESPTSNENPLTVTFAKMDIEAISQGDYSSLVGKWVSKDGDVITFNVLGIVGDSKIESPSKIVEGVLETGLRNSSGYGTGWLMIPAGVPIPKGYYLENDYSDINRDRMFGAQSVLQNIENSSVYYRVPSQTTIESNPLTNDDTGVRLDSGQSTIDYANAILGPLNWKIIESNYNRTESIPFELLQGENGWLYRVYRNGVILSQTKNVIIYMP